MIDPNYAVKYVSVIEASRSTIEIESQSFKFISELAIDLESRLCPHSIDDVLSYNSPFTIQLLGKVFIKDECTP